MERTKHQIVLDMDPGERAPRRGDYLVAMGKRGPGARYKIGISRKVQRRDPAAPPRYQLKVWRVEDVPQGEMVITFTWHPRKKKWRTFEEYMRRGIGKL